MCVSSLVGWLCGVYVIIAIAIFPIPILLVYFRIFFQTITQKKQQQTNLIYRLYFVRVYVLLNHENNKLQQPKSI